LLTSHFDQGGVITGLAVAIVKTTSGATELAVEPGVALDSRGRLISLASKGGRAYIPDRIDPSELGDNVLTIPQITFLKYKEKIIVISIKYDETIIGNDADAEIELTPRLGFTDINPLSDSDEISIGDDAVVLAVVKVDRDGKLEWIRDSYGLTQRQVSSQAVGGIKIIRTATLGSNVSQTVAGELKPSRFNGGLEFEGTLNLSDKQLLISDESNIFRPIHHYIILKSNHLVLINEIPMLGNEPTSYPVKLYNGNDGNARDTTVITFDRAIHPKKLFFVPIPTKGFDATTSSEPPFGVNVMFRVTYHFSFQRLGLPWEHLQSKVKPKFSLKIRGMVAGSDAEEIIEMSSSDFGMSGGLEPVSYQYRINSRTVNPYMFDSIYDIGLQLSYNSEIKHTDFGISVSNITCSAYVNSAELSRTQS
jgi:hypothetical protein